MGSTIVMVPNSSFIKKITFANLQAKSVDFRGRILRSEWLIVQQKQYVHNMLAAINHFTLSPNAKTYKRLGMAFISKFKNDTVQEMYAKVRLSVKELKNLKQLFKILHQKLLDEYNRF